MVGINNGCVSETVPQGRNVQAPMWYWQNTSKTRVGLYETTGSWKNRKMVQVNDRRYLTFGPDEWVYAAETNEPSWLVNLNGYFLWKQNPKHEALFRPATFATEEQFKTLCADCQTQRGSNISLVNNSTTVIENNKGNINLSSEMIGVNNNGGMKVLNGLKCIWRYTVGALCSGVAKCGKWCLKKIS